MSTDRRALPGFFTTLAVQLAAVGSALGVLACGTGVGVALTPVLGPLGPLGGILCFAASAPVVGLAGGLFLRRRLTGPLDRAFAPVSDAPRRFLLSGRAWLGDRGGREVQVTMVRGPALQVTVACDARGRLAVGWKNALASGLAGFRGLTELPLPGGRADLGAWAADPEWATPILTDHRVGPALARLLADDGLASIRAVNVEADCVLWTLRRPSHAMGPDEALARIDDLVAIAEVVEAAPLPRSPVAPGGALRPAPLTVRPRPA